MKLSRIVLVFAFTAVALPVFGQNVQNQWYEYSGTKWKAQENFEWQSLAPSGTWWRNQSYITRLSLTADQQKRMDDVFQQSRIKLIDLKASFDREEAILEPLLKAERLDEIKVAAQLDKVADARAELEKANSRMLLGVRMVLTPEQWKTLNSSKIGAYYSTLKEKAKLEAKQDIVKPPKP